MNDNPIDPITMTLVNGWIEAEREEGNYLELANDDMISIALDRVRLVLAGEVRWSEATPGDRRVWRGRARDVLRFGRHWRSREGQVDPFAESETPSRGGIAASREARATRYRYLNMWDTAIVAPGTDVEDDGFVNHFGAVEGPRNRSVRLFGNANIGNLRLTNLQIPGQLSAEQTAYIAEMYISATDFDGLVAMADRILATFVIGNMPLLQVPARDLVHGVPVKNTIPPRQNFSVVLDMFSTKVSRRRFDLFEISIHLEGVQSRPVY